MLPEFDFLMPKTLPEALEYLAKGGTDIMPVAGGTNLVIDMRGKRHRPKIVMAVNLLPELAGIHREDDYIVTGAAVTVAEFLNHPLITDKAPVLQQAARTFANPLIRNRATVGGNLADGSPAADTAPALLVLDADVILTSRSGKRIVPLNDFFIHVRKTALKPDELLTAVRWKVPVNGTKFAYYKLGLRRADAISIVSIAVCLETDSAGHCKQARIALGSVAPRPLRAIAAEEYLTGKPLSIETFEQAGKLAADAVSPISDVRASADYRRKMASTLVIRLLSQTASLKD
jgi:carbon-monoxide dehydrogenase medium subunit